MLSVEALQAGYDAIKVLFDVSLSVRSGEFVSLMGRNGMGKTTTIRAIMGMLGRKQGQVLYDGQDITRWPSHRVARLGLGLVPEGRQIFPRLTVRENLLVTARRSRDPDRAWSLPRLYALFPILKERGDQPGATLSGGEQQMLAIGRALMTNPSLLILDEATEGLAPRIREDIWSGLAALKAQGQSILIVDKDLARMAELADRHYILEKGRTVWQGSKAELDRDVVIVKQHLGV